MAQELDINPKTHIIRVNEKSIRVWCDCENEYNVKIDTFDPQIVPETGTYETLRTECPACNQITFFNMDLPESEHDEQEIYEEPFFPPGEKEARELVRQVMWKARKDLKGKDRAAFEKNKKAELEKAYGLPINEIKKNAQRVARLFTENNF